MAAEDDPLGGAEEQMVAYEIEAFFTLLRKVRSRLGARPGGLVGIDPDTQIDVAVAAAFRQTLAEDPDARELTEQLATFLRFGTATLTRAVEVRGHRRAREDLSL